METGGCPGGRGDEQRSEAWGGSGAVSKRSILPSPGYSSASARSEGTSKRYSAFGRTTFWISSVTSEKQPAGYLPKPALCWRGYDWPGNIRELAHTIAGALALTDGDVLTPDDLPSEVQDAEIRRDRGIYSLPYKDARRICMDRFTQEYLHRALVKTGGNVSRAARKSGIGRQYFQLRMSEHGMTAAQYRKQTKDAHMQVYRAASGD